jgi:hypothetical protein
MNTVTSRTAVAADTAQALARPVIILGNAVLSNAPLLSLNLPPEVDRG